MKERFPGAEQRPSAEELEKKFWDEEIKAWSEEYKGPIDKMTEEEIKTKLYNNIKKWLPGDGRSSMFGSERLELKHLKGPEKKEALKLIADIDKYLAEYNLLPLVKGMEAQYRENREVVSKAQIAGTHVTEWPEARLTHGELVEFYADLYYAMRVKGYPRKFLNT